MRRLNTEKLEAETVETRWDIKRIVIGILIAIALIILGSYMLFPPRGGRDSLNGGTLGITSHEDKAGTGRKEVLLPTKENIETVIHNAQETLSELTSENLTSSQAAIQKLIADLQKLQENKDTVGVICDLVCKK